ncbi:MAG: 6-phosphogluconolactonase [Phycisphaerales bacterium]|nr:6-phosphogluconolactonase [Phycisphaerales bacterium]
MTALRVQVVPNEASAAIRGAQVLSDLLRRAIIAKGEATFAVSGGTTPWPMLEQLAKDSVVEWNKVHLLQVDERVAPDGDADRNWTAIKRIFLDSGLISEDHAWPMPVTTDDLFGAGREYQKQIRSLRPDGQIDVIQLGLGDDGHTASLAPGDPVCDLTVEDVGTTSGPFNGHRRMTLTRGALNRAGTIVWYVIGESKQDAVRKLLDGDLSIPAGHVDPDDAILVADAAARGEG